MDEGQLADSEWLSIDGSGSLTLSPPAGAKTAYAILLGPHNVTSLVITGGITLDQAPPTVQFTSPVKQRTEDDTAVLELVVLDDLDPSPVVRWRLNNGEWNPYEGPAGLRLKEGGNTIEVEAEDAAGNLASASWSIDRDVGFKVGGPSLIVLLIVAIVVPVGIWYWYKKRQESALE